MSKKREISKRVPWAIVTLLVIPVAAAAGFLRYYRKAFDFEPQIVPFGACIVLAIIGCWVVVTQLATMTRSTKLNAWAATLSAATLTLIFSAISAIYVGAYLSNRIWGDTLDYAVVATFAAQPAAAIAFLPLTNFDKAALASGLLVTSVLIAFALALISCRLTRWLIEENLLLNARFAYYPRSMKFAVPMISTGIALAAMGYGVALNSLRVSTLRGEPVTSFLKLRPTTNLAKLDNTRLTAAFQDQASRDAYPRTTSFEKKNVVLIFSDSLRADRMGVYGYARPTTPFLSQLFDGGRLHKVDMALSTCSESYCGIASTFASRPYHELSVHSFKLHELLHDVGYKIDFFLSGDHKSWGYLREFYGSNIDGLPDTSSLKGQNINDDENVLNALNKLDQFQGDPHFLYIFLMSSHVSGRKLPEFERYTPSKIDGARILTFWNELAGTRRVKGQILPGNSVLSANDLEAIRNRYDNGVLQADDAFRRIFAVLQIKGYLENSIVFILGDHGDGLGEHGHIGHTRFLYQEDIRVPLLIYDQAASLYRNRVYAVQPDVAPTILDRLGLPIPVGWKGQSILKKPKARTTFHQTRRGKQACFAAVTHSETNFLKYVRCGLSSKDRQEMLFDLRTDPNERFNMIERAESIDLRRMRDEISSRFEFARNGCASFECVD